MRKVELFNDHWLFYGKDKKEQLITLPHTWNAIDGQDGGNDYYRGICSYKKTFRTPKEIEGNRIFIEFRGVNSSARVYLNDKELAVHHGGYSTFRVELTKDIRYLDSRTNVVTEWNELLIKVDNSKNDFVYPQKADFTFYGGIYRDVYLITAPKIHFELNNYGSSGFYVTPRIDPQTGKAMIELKASITDYEKVCTTTGIYNVRFSIDGVGSVTTCIEDGIAQGVIEIKNVHLWNGVIDPYLYTARAQILFENTASTANIERPSLVAEGLDIIDEVKTRFGCRSFDFDAEKGFRLNGDSYPLRGVSRHQDWKGVGNALTHKMQDKDIEIIMEMGVNTIRLAHYQHDQYFYDLCDEVGMVVWAEIPYISEHLSTEAANENTTNQLTELILQNYNHPSIVTWSLSNEITVTMINDDLRANHKHLNDLAHRLDTTRPTSMAHVTFLDKDDPLVHLTDICSFNHYFGWYFGSLTDNDQWFDEFHTAYPKRIIGLAEYGADANISFQTNNPEQGDYSEQYQCVYHEHMLEMISSRDYLWGTHMWNMFDFGADGRSEGGSKGLNQKGLVSFDRRTKKDSFYLYKAYYSNEPFVHICGKRYSDRTEDETEIKVYTNQKNLRLYLNDKLVEDKNGDKIFVFKIRIGEKSTTKNLKNHHDEVDFDKILVKSSELSDNCLIRKVSKSNPTYSLMGRNINNWYESDMEFPKGYFSIKDTIGSIKENQQGKVIIDKMLAEARSQRGDVAQGLEHNEVLERMTNSQTVEALIKKSGGSIKPERVISLNKALTKIKKTSED